MPRLVDKSSEALDARVAAAHGREHSRVRAGVLAPLLAMVAACGGGEVVEMRPGAAPKELPDEELVEPIGEKQYALGATVGSFEQSSCSTSVVIGLSKQIAEEVGCIAPGSLVPFTEGNGIDFTGSAVLPYISAKAKQDLEAAVQAQGGTLQVNSAYRTVAQQYLLYRWFQLGRCGITAAATPGSSNHESGRALDVNNYSTWIGALEARGWSHSVPGDPVHFDHLGSPDNRGQDVLAFQRLWNRNNPGDVIAEDGDYGPQTAARLAKSPADGFAKGADCGGGGGGGGGDTWNAKVATSTPPLEAPPGARVEARVELENTGNTTWKPGEVFLGTTAPRDRESALYDAMDWIAPHRATTVDAETAPGQVGTFTFVLAAPAVTEETSYSETFGLVREGVTWFGPEDVTVELVVRPGAGPADDPGGGGGAGGDGAGDGDGDGGTFHVGGGCSVGGGSGAGGAPGAWWMVLAAGTWLARRRLRKR